MATRRMFRNFVSGTLSSGISNTATTISSSALTSLPVIADPDYFPLTLDPEAVSGAPEIVWVTAHSSGSSNATVLRGQEGTTARSHVSGTKLVGAVTAQAITDLRGFAEAHGARHASSGADPLPSDAVSAAQLASGSVTTTKILDGAVSSAKLADGSVLTAKIADGAISTVKLADSAVTAAKIGSGAVTTAKLADGAVTSAKIGSGAVTATELASSAVTTVKINDGAVTAAKIANNFLPSYIRSAFNSGSTGVSVGTSTVTVMSATLSIPTDWASWEAEAYAFYRATDVSGGTREVWIRIAGDDGPITQLVPDQGHSGVAHRLTGLTVTGSVVVSLMATTSSGSFIIRHRHLVARAFRTG